MSTDRPWLENYPAGLPANIDPTIYPTLNDFIDQALQRMKKEPVISNMGKEIKGGEVKKLATQLAAYLQSRGLKAGDKIAIMMPNMLQYPIALFGSLKAGLVIVNTNPLYTPREMLHQFQSSGVKGIIIAENFAANLQKVLDKTEIETIIITSIGEMQGWVKGAFIDFAVRNLKKLVPSYDLPNTVTFSEALKQGKNFTVDEPDQNPDTVIFHQYTGGTTGVAKGAMLTNRNMVANMLQIKELFKPHIKQNSVALCPLPMYHIFALTVNAFAMLELGALNVMVTNPRDLDSIVREFKRYKVRKMTGVNTLYNALLHHKKFRELDLSHLEFTIAGGMALKQSVSDQWKELTGHMIIEGYGLTETSPVASVNSLDQTGKSGSIGYPVPSTYMKICDNEGNELPRGTAGEIYIKGPQVMKGYYNDPAASQDVLTSEGWLKTGDIGLMDEDAFYFIVDRKKDIINVSGFNVYPNEIEEYLMTHPDIIEVAAIGVPDEKSNELVKVFINTNNKRLKKKDVVAFAEQGLTRYKIPKYVEFTKDLPKSNVGKILRRKLR